MLIITSGIVRTREWFTFKLPEEIYKGVEMLEMPECIVEREQDR